MLFVEQLIAANKIACIFIFICSIISGNRPKDKDKEIPDRNQIYCNPNLCPPKTQHITCNLDNWRVKKGCNYTSVAIDHGDHRKIVEFHNRHRNKIAGGNLKGFQPATRMARMGYSHGLAQMAQLNILRCESKPDYCHNTYLYPCSGQNLYALERPASFTTTDFKKELTNVIDFWYSQYRYTDASCMEKYREDRNLAHNFALGVTDRNTRVGCAAIRMNDGTDCTYFFCCDYSSIVVEGREVYHAGPVASHCKSGTDHDLANLCSVAESFDSPYPPDHSTDTQPLYKALKYVSIIVLLIIILTAIGISAKYLVPRRA